MKGFLCLVLTLTIFLALCDAKGLHRTKRTTIANYTNVWSNGIVPYVFDASFDASGVTLVKAAFSAFQNKTCARFVERTVEADYIKIKDDGYLDCGTFGRVGGEQLFSLPPSTSSLGDAIHQLGHVLGFQHEEIRYDRDQYITVDLSVVDPLMASYYDVIPLDKLNPRSIKSKYDYTSVMHSSPYNGDMTSKDASAQNVIGQREGFGKCDASKINYVYSCIDGDKLRECFQTDFCINK